jgi:hypothetical protein
VMWILGILRFKSIHLFFYTFIHIIHMYTSYLQWTNDGSQVCVCSTLKMRSVMCISYCLHDWQTIFIILFSSFWTVDREKIHYCACEILTANPIDWLFAACLELFFLDRQFRS